MKFNVTEIVEDAMICFGVVISIDQIESILGIVILSFEICWILWKGISRIIKHVKNKDYKSAIEETQNTLEDINNVVDKHKKDGK